MRKKRSGALGKQDWISGARKLLIKSGIANVKVEPLAKALNVTTGSFYWHFAKREDLYDALLQDWYDTNTAPLHRAVEGAGPDPRQQYLAFFGVWVLERAQSGKTRVAREQRQRLRGGQSILCRAGAHTRL